MNNLNETNIELEKLLYTNYVGRSAIREIIKILKNLFTSSQFPSETLYNMIGELMMIHPEHFMERLYPAIEKKLKLLVNFEEMDEFILKKYCLLEDEEIIAKCPGNISSAGMITKGRFYLTNYRIIGCGIQTIKQRFNYPGRSVIGAALMAYISAKSSLRINALSKALGKEISEMGRWGYEFPIDDVVGIKKTKRFVFYLKVLYNGEQPLKRSIRVNPYAQTPHQYGAEREEVLNHVHQLLQKHTITKNCPKCNVRMDPIEPTEYYFDFYKCPICKKTIKQKKVYCPECRIFMEVLENDSEYNYQCTQCKKKFKEEN